MRKGIHKIMSALLSAAMILGSTSGTAFAETAGKLFADGETLVLIKTDEIHGGDDDRYASGFFKIASAANAAIASGSDAVVKASDSDAIEVGITESGEEDGYLLEASVTENYWMPNGQKFDEKQVELEANGKTFKGKVKIRRNFIPRSKYVMDSHVKTYKIDHADHADVDDENTLSAKVYDGFDSDGILDGVKIDFNGHWQELSLDFSELDADVGHEMRIEVYDGDTRIGWCYLVLPAAPELSVNGEPVGYGKVSDYLDSLGDGGKENITELEIFSGTMEYGDWMALATLKNLESLTIGADVETRMYYIDNNIFKDHTSLKRVSLNESGKSRSTDAAITTIHDGAFSGCTSLEEVTAPGVTNIGESAFKGCTSLNKIEIPDAYFVGDNIFSECTSLKEIELPKVTYIYESAFKGCTSLEFVSMPMIQAIDEDAFKECKNLKKIVLNGVKVPSVSSSSFEPEVLPLEYDMMGSDGELLTGDALAKMVSAYCSSWAYPDWNVILGGAVQEEDRGLSVAYRKGTGSTDYEYALGKTLKECMDQISEPEKITVFEVRMGKIALEDWKELEKLTGLKWLEFQNGQFDSEMPSDLKLSKSLEFLNLGSLNVIPAHMFKNYKKLSQIVMFSVSEIGDGAFEGCEKLCRLHFPKVPPKLGKDVFKGCTADSKSGSWYDGDKTPYENGDPQWKIWTDSSSTPVTPPVNPDRPGNSGGSSSNRDSGKWILDGRGWWYQKDSGYYLYSQWSDLEYNGTYERYYFNQDGYMVTGWYTDENGRTYYLHPIADGTRGRMYKGWNLIDGKWYYFNKEFGEMQGVLLKNTTTPDGYAVDENGVWIQ